MAKRELVVNALEAMGYKPQIDDDGDVYLHYQMKVVYVLGTQQEESKYLVVMLHQFCEIKQGEEIKTLTVCNKLTRDLTLAKVYIDKNLQDVTSCCEIYYCDEECLTSQLERSLAILGQIRSVFAKAMSEFDE